MFYRSDISREQFEKIKPILESTRNKTRPRQIGLYRVFCAILYLLKSSCQRQMLPKGYPQRQICYYYFKIWSQKQKNGSDSTLEIILKKNGWIGTEKQWSERKNDLL